MIFYSTFSFLNRFKNNSKYNTYGPKERRFHGHPWSEKGSQQTYCKLTMT